MPPLFYPFIAAGLDLSLHHRKSNPGICGIFSTPPMISVRWSMNHSQIWPSTSSKGQSCQLPSGGDDALRTPIRAELAIAAFKMLPFIICHSVEVADMA